MPSTLDSVGDFFGPTFKLEFIIPQVPSLSVTQNTTALEVAQGVSSVIKQVQDQNDLTNLHLEKYVTNLTVESTGGGPKQFTIILNPPYNDGVKILESGLIRFGNIVKINFGYSGNNGTIMSGDHFFLLTHPKAQFGTNISITLTGWDPFTHRLKERQRDTKIDRATYPTDFQLLNYITKIMKCLLDVSELTANVNLDEDIVPHPIFIAQDSEIDQSVDYWTLFRDTCRRNNITFKIAEKNIIKVFDTKTITQAAGPFYRFLLYSPPTENTDIPMMSFTTNPLPSIFAPQDFMGFVRSRFNKDTGNVERKNINNQTTTDVKTSGDPTDVGANLSAGTGTPIPQASGLINNPLAFLDIPRLITVPHEYTQADGSITQSHLEGTLLYNTNATITAPGVPFIFPPINIEVVGTTKSFDGKYLVLNAKHNIGTSGYEMTLEAYRTSTPSSSDKASPLPLPKTVVGVEKGAAPVGENTTSILT